MNPRVKCPDPNCTGDQSHLTYVQRMYEYWSLDAMPNEDGCIELNICESAYTDEQFSPYLACSKCGNDFKLNGEIKG